MTSHAKALLFLAAGTFAWWLTNSGLPAACPVLLRLMVPGLLLGLVEAGSLDGAWRRTAAVLLGGIGSIAGIRLGQQATISMIQAVSPGDPHFWQVSRLEDCIIYGLFGLLLGLFLSLPRLSVLLTAQYALGGLLGGLGGLFLLRLILQPSFHAASVMLLLGGGWGVTALGIGLLPALFRQTWLTADDPWRREFLLVHNIVTLGSAPNADVRVSASPQVAPIHAVIELLPGMGRRRLRHAAGGQGMHAFPPTLVNGRPVTGEQWLSDNDKIRIGSRLWIFHDRATRGALRLGPPMPEAWGQAKQKQPPLVFDKAGNAVPPQSIVSTTGQASPQNLSPLLRDIAESTPQHVAARDIGRVGTRLVCIEGPYAGRVYRLGQGETQIGSDPSCAVPLPSDVGVTPVQARLVAQPKGGHTLLPAGTESVTLVNNRRVTSPLVLLPGDRIQVGGTALRYQ